MDDFDYLPEYGWPAEEAPYGGYAGEEVPYGGYTGYEAAPQTGYEAAPPTGRHSAGQPDYPATRAYGVPPHLVTDRRRAPGRPPREPGEGRGYGAPASGPMQAYQPPNGGPARGYPPSPGNPPRPAYPPYGDPARTYRPDRTDPMTAYRPDMNGSATPAYQPRLSGPMPAYQSPNERAARGERVSVGLLSDFPVSEPIRTYQPPADYQPPAHRAVPRRPAADGREVLGWLPFGNRLVLLPKDARADDGELREHRDVSDGWLRPAVFGAMDGLVTNASLIAGVGAGAGAGGGATGMIVLTGIAGLVAGAFSMATGEYISVSSQNELNLAEVELERRQHERDPVGKLRRLAHLFVEKGVSPNLAEAVVRQISADPERAIDEHLKQELGIDPDDLPSPRTAALASLASFTLGALIPLSPFLAGYPVLKVALVLSGAFAFIGGAAVAKLTGRSMLLGGLRQFTAAALGTGAAFFIGHAIGGHIS